MMDFSIAMLVYQRVRDIVISTQSLKERRMVSVMWVYEAAIFSVGVMWVFVVSRAIHPFQMHGQVWPATTSTLGATNGDWYVEI